MQRKRLLLLYTWLWMGGDENDLTTDRSINLVSDCNFFVVVKTTTYKRNTAKPAPTHKINKHNSAFNISIRQQNKWIHNIRKESLYDVIRLAGWKPIINDETEVSLEVSRLRKRRKEEEKVWLHCWIAKRYLLWIAKKCGTRNTWGAGKRERKRVRSELKRYIKKKGKNQSGSVTSHWAICAARKNQRVGSKQKSSIDKR